MRKGCVFLHGSYYSRNFGDYLLFRIILDAIRSEFPDVDVVLPFASKEVLTEFRGEVRAATLRDFFRAELFVFGGGGYLGEPPKAILRWSINFLRRHYLPFFLIRILRVPVAIIGAGAGPISSFWLTPFVRHMLSKSIPVILRDKESVDFARSLGIHPDRIGLGTDLAQSPAFLKRITGAIQPYLLGDYVGIHIGLNLTGECEEAIEIELRKICTGGGSVVLFVDSPGHDVAIDTGRYPFRQLVLDFPSVVSLCKYSDAEEVIAIIQHSLGVITGKLHVGIVACTLGVPVLSIPVHHKTERYYRHIGMTDSCVTSADQFERKMEFFFDKVHGKVRTILPSHVDEAHQKTLNSLIKAVRSARQ